ncbi:hypothetical protein AB6A40_011319 [Gnathostoma spinigerum]|uniref:Uncharacterized protein n=1 Tax=Gnathostoma spinigerum TaxID=75299 RepID=A0ABD6EYS4_9BILA
MSSTKESDTKSSSEYEIAYRSTIQPRTAVRTQTRTSGAYSVGGPVGGGGGKLNKTGTNTKIRKFLPDTYRRVTWRTFDYMGT